MNLLILALSFGKIEGFAAFAYLTAKATEELKNDPNHKPSTLRA